MSILIRRGVMLLAILLTLTLCGFIRAADDDDEAPTSVFWELLICQDHLEKWFGYDNYYVYANARIYGGLYADVWLDSYSASEDDGTVIFHTFTTLIDGITELVGVLMRPDSSITLTLSTFDWGSKTVTIDSHRDYPKCGTWDDENQPGDAPVVRLITSEIVSEDPNAFYKPIEIPEIAGACFLVHYRNPDGGWSLVVDKLHPKGIVVRGDEEGNVYLIVNPVTGDTDPRHYLLQYISCP
jgi:hypothetical protein